MGSDSPELEELPLQNGTTNHTYDGSTNTNITVEQDELVPEVQLLNGTKLLLYQIEALLRKKFYHTSRNWVLLFLQNFIPVVFIILTIMVVRTWGNNKDLPSLHLVTEKYNPTVTLLELNSTWQYDDFSNRYFILLYIKLSK